MKNCYRYSPSSADSRRVIVSYKRMYVQEVVINCFVKLAQEKVCLGELTIAVDWDVKPHLKQINKTMF